MSLEGNVSGGTLHGRINPLDTLCISAYEIAVKHGFVGTEAEWLESLNGDHMNKEQIEKAVDDYIKAHPPDVWNGLYITLKDQSTSKSYKLYVEGGKLTMEEAEV